jgi:hypothetical protein
MWKKAWRVIDYRLFKGPWSWDWKCVLSVFFVDMEEKEELFKLPKSYFGATTPSLVPWSMNGDVLFLEFARGAEEVESREEACETAVIVSVL